MLLPLLFLNTATAQNTRMFPVNEDFESGTFPPTGWNTYNLFSATINWVASSDFNHTPGGSLSAMHGYAAGGNDNWMVTPAMEIPAAGVTVLSFWNYVIDPMYYDLGRNSVAISNGSGDPSDGDFVEIWTTAQPLAEWIEIAIGLESYAGQTV